jgi:hypothetical protein
VDRSEAARRQIRPGYDEIAATKDTYTQDQIRSATDKRLGLLPLDGNKTPWDVSIIDREFSHKNGESMLLKLDETLLLLRRRQAVKITSPSTPEVRYGPSDRQIFEAQFGASTWSSAPRRRADRDGRFAGHRPG